ncbi:tetratricopeptide repeat protein [Streptomyces microflavus]|uniref:hypothetical protein n=1 Tax=Streptomyces microflavus TaxID=1919 RepID=UPI0033346110
MTRKSASTARDDFSKGVKDDLARRVAARCSNPECRAVTFGPKLGSSGVVNVGVAAHITAASPGGPRYDPSLTPTERASGQNGIWLCQNCGKLIDSDAPRYTSATLHQWKLEAEHETLRMLAGVGPSVDRLTLALPQLDSPESLLAFANTAIARVGRDDELRELTTFLESNQAFSWWLWTGAAGVGKSRLAIELCRAMSGEWHAGFLREDDQSALSGLQPTRPTLVVVDYAAQRSEWLSEALFRLSQQTLSAPVRVLVLERQAAGPWWDTVQRTHRMEESSHVQASSFGLPRELGGLSRGNVRRLITAVAVHAHADLSSTNIEDIADHAERIDARRRPLFAIVAAMDWLDSNGVSADRNGALRRLIARMNGQMMPSLGNLPRPQRAAQNVVTLATALGGLSVDAYARLLRDVPQPVGLLPGMYEDFGPASLDDLLDGLRPDILGELYVLDRLAATGVERAATVDLLQLAWQADEQAYLAFVERTAGDHREHDRLLDLLGVAHPNESPLACARLMASTVPLLQRSDHPALEWIFSRLDDLRISFEEQDIEEQAITARFQFGNLVLNEGDTRRANSIFTEALSECAPRWPVHTSLLNNRGITWLKLDDQKSAKADFTAVIDDEMADDEARACSFNNRADIHDDDEDLPAAIADRTAVLALSATSHNRRYIALGRRAITQRKLGNKDHAYQDIESILQTVDISSEQKMSARLLRAEWLLIDGATPEARLDLQTVIMSARNFDSVERRARELLSDTLASEE